MHAGIANYGVPLKSVAGKTFPIIPVHAQPSILRVWQQADVWWAAAISSPIKIVLFQKRAIRIIWNVNRRALTGALFRELRFSPSTDFTPFLISRFMSRCILFAGYVKQTLVLTVIVSDTPFMYISWMLKATSLKILDAVELIYRNICNRYTHWLGNFRVVIANSVEYHMRNNMLRALRTIR